jgi:Streptomycin adenylyltransferase
VIVEGRDWIEALPAALAPQAALLARLLETAEADQRLRALELQGSVARGVGDELSDLDAGLWLADDRFEETASELPEAIGGLGPTLDLHSTLLGGRPDLFVQFVDGVQFDLLVRPVSEAKGRVPDSVVLLDRDGVLKAPYEPPSAAASLADAAEWSFQAWLALLNLDKYLRRGSLWEARAALEEARGYLLRLHAARLSVRYPAFGLTSLLDSDSPERLPPGLERTCADLDAVDLRRAARACAELLGPYRRPLAELADERLAG